VKVQLKMDDVGIELGTKGILLKLTGTDGKHRGDLRIGKATVEWMRGRTHEGNGKMMKLQDLIDLLETEQP
jgi:hypothetical protein